MTLIRWDPSESLMPLREAMHRLFEESFIGPRLERIRARERLRHKREVIKSCSRQCGYSL